MRKKLSFLSVMVLSLILPAGAIAETPGGRLTIEPMVFTPEPMLDPDTGEPLINPNTGEVITTDVYQGGSYFSMAGGNPYSPNTVSIDSIGYSGLLLNTNQNFRLDPDEPHPEGHPDAPNGAGSGYSALTEEAGVMAPFSFFGIQTHLGTNALSYQSGEYKPVVSVEHDGFGNLTAELSAIEVFWNGSVFEQGPRPSNTGPFGLATGTYDSATGHYVLDWVSQIKGGPFSGVPGTWRMEGTHVVPIPGALVLLVPGVVGLIGFNRRKKNSH